jgi:hypothetical protein
LNWLKSLINFISFTEVSWLRDRCNLLISVLQTANSFIFILLLSWSFVTVCVPFKPFDFIGIVELSFANLHGGVESKGILRNVYAQNDLLVLLELDTVSKLRVLNGEGSQLPEARVAVIITSVHIQWDVASNQGSNKHV